MSESVNLDSTLQRICEDFHIEIADSRYYVNESTWYEFNIEDDLFLVASELLKVAHSEHCSLHLTISTDNVYSLELHII